MSKIYHHPVQIYYEDTDHSGVVYHPNFLKYFERAREHVIDSDRLAKLWNEQGLGFAVYKANMTFQDGVEFAEVCDIRTTVTLDGKYKTLWRQEVWRPNSSRAAVIGDIEMVCMDKQKRLQPIPDEIMTAMQLT
ncbi:thioesterase family protein [Vibrio sp. Of7-15]|uniref:acyl-CoA thioesterase n=1 Tax=Vibrio sp. Of7-15 TaxID=2724879 RepID=UPI001EF3663D|nr:thioesterase family protein [Vibrio sp. Of7-15]MCG7497280.1 thioesterase family protein [Vibrio sp. Of7-15]